MQNGLAEWLAFLSEKPLPVLKLTQKSVQQLINQSQLSITQYAGPILFDAGFAAYIFRHVNTQRIKAGKNPLTTLDNALSHLGQGAFQTLLKKVSVFEGLQLPEKNRLGYLRVMGQACHGALQAKDWARQRNVLQPEETQLATLLQSITELLLWCYGDTVMREIEYQFYAKKKAYEAAAKTVLGCGMRELGAALAVRWNLPEMATEGLNSRQDNFTLATGVSLAAELGRVVSQNWYGQRAEDVIQRIATYKAKSEGEIKRRLHMNAVEFSGCLSEKGYAAPARLIPMLAADDFIDPLFVFHKKNKADDAERRTSEAKIPQKKTPRLEAIKKKSIEKQQGAVVSKPPVKKSAIIPENKKRSVDEVLEKYREQKDKGILKAPSVGKKPQQEKTAAAPEARMKVSERVISKNIAGKGSAQKEQPPKGSIVKGATVKEQARKEQLNKATGQAVAGQEAATQTSPVNQVKPSVNVKTPASLPTADKSKRPPALSPELAAAIKEFQLMVKQAKPAHDLIEKAVNVSLLCGVQRCVFSVKLPNKNMLVSRYSAQTRDDIAIKNLKIPIKTPHVFTLLMEKSRNIFLNDSNRAKYWNSIPDTVKLSIGVKHFFSVSVFVNNHAMGLMYADKVKGDLTQTEFSQFQGICRLLSKGIVQSAHNKKTA